MFLSASKTLTYSKLYGLDKGLKKGFHKGMKNYFLNLLVLIGIFPQTGMAQKPAPTLSNPPSAQKLLEASDRLRGSLLGGIEWRVTINSTENGEKSTRVYAVRALENNAYVETLDPARLKGEIFLFLDRNMWFYRPGTRKPISISARQKLTGQAANGDIASTNYSKDYSATITGTATLGSMKTHVLLLKAKADNLTYDQIRYFISQTNQQALKAEYLTVSGETFKVGTFEYKNSILVKGKKLPFVSKLTIRDARNPKEESVLIYSAPRLTNISPGLFNVNTLSR